MKDETFLGRWSRRKKESAAGTAQETPEAGRIATTAGVVPAQAGAQVPAEPTTDAAPAQQAGSRQPLPPVESLTPESDFAPFMGREVDEGVRRQALKALFRDPRFNVMDGLDVYIDDYSKPDPLPEGWLEKLNQVARLGDYQPPPEAAPAREPEEKPSAEEPIEASAPPRTPDTSSDGNTPSKVG
jgi:hypothetical protein